MKLRETKCGVWRDEVVSGTQAGPDTTVKQLFGYEQVINADEFIYLTVLQCMFHVKHILHVIQANSSFFNQIK